MYPVFAPIFIRFTHIHFIVVASVIVLAGKIYLSWHMSEPTLNISDTEMAKQVLSNKDDSFVKAKPISLGKMLVGCGLVTAEGENWVKQRKLANHAFHGESLKVKKKIEEQKLGLN